MLIFDLTAVQESGGHTHGGGEYTKSVLAELIRRKRLNNVVGVARIGNKFLDGVNDILGNSVEIEYYRDRSELQELLKKFGKCSLYSGLPYHLSGISAPNADALLTIHGFRDIECPSDAYENRYRRSLRDVAIGTFKCLRPEGYQKFRRSQFLKLLQIDCKSLSLVAPSEHTKYLLKALFPATRVSCQVLYAPPVSDEEPLSATPTENPYFLMVSGGRWIKNAYRAIISFQKFKTISGAPHELIITGGVPLLSELEGTGVRHVGRLSRGELLELHRGADALLYPSLNEGFGYPPLDSMRYGIPVLGSAIASTMEIYGSAVSYFSPTSTLEMTKRLIQFHDDPGERARLSRAGLQRFKEVHQRQESDLVKLCELIENFGA